MQDNISAATIIETTLSLSPSERVEYLNALGRSADLDAAVVEAASSLESCLDALRTAGAFHAHAALTPTATKKLEPGKLDNYTLGELLGSGGFSDVYAATQLLPVEREVAVKVLRPGQGGEGVAARFALESQALAQLEHPNIASIFDAGETEIGQPFFVMERVHGSSITEFCKARSLSLDARLELFRAVCDAVEYAHTRGIIHRDLKASNILVSDRLAKPLVKVIDFGIAKAVESGNQAPITVHGDFLGTPTSMSPEQLGVISMPLDTRTDVYSLGMLLYEMLTDLHPLNTGSSEAALMTAWRYANGDASIQKPSRRCRDSMTNTRSFARALRGDLDWIVFRAIRQQPADRYQSVVGFKADLERFARHEPVSAGPPSMTYRSTKFIRRHWIFLTAGFLIAASVLTALLQTNAERRLTEQALKDLTTVADFQGQMLADLDPYVLGRDLRDGFEAQFSVNSDRFDAQLREQLRRVNYTDLSRQFINTSILSRAGHTLETRFAEQPNVASRLRQSLGHVYLSLGLRTSATKEFEMALALHELSADSDPYRKLTLLGDLANAYDQNGRYDEALTSATMRVEYGLGFLDNAHPQYLEALSDLASVHISFGNYGEAERLQKLAIDGYEKVYGPNHAKLLDELHEYATIIHHQGRLDESLRLREEILAAKEQILDPLDNRLIISLIGLGSIHHHLGNLTEARSFIDEAFDRRRLVLGDDHPRTLSLYNRMAALAFDQGDMTTAERLARDALERFDRLPEADEPRRLLIRETLGRILGTLDKTDEALAILQQAYDDSVRFQGADNPETLGALFSLASMNLLAGNFTEAGAQLEAIHDGYLQTWGPDHPRYAMLLVGLAAVDTNEQVYQRAESRLAQAETIYTAKLGTTEHRLIANLLVRQAELLQATGNMQSALTKLRRAAAMYQALGQQREASKLEHRVRDYSRRSSS